MQARRARGTAIIDGRSARAARVLFHIKIGLSTTYIAFNDLLLIRFEHRHAEVNISIHLRNRLSLDESLCVLERRLPTLADRLGTGSHHALRQEPKAT